LDRADHTDDHLRSFTSILFALLHGGAPLSRWFLRYARAAGVKLDDMYATRKFNPAATLQTIRERREGGEMLSGKPPVTASAKNMANGAAGLTSRGGRSGLGLRHLLASYIYAVPQDHQERMRAWGFEGHRDGSAFVRQIRDRHPDELDYWAAEHVQAMGRPPDLDGRDPAPPARVSGFAADTPDGEDHLDIEDDVYALSALICSRQVIPPLSIGLFGDWGSGKSFFMRRLRRGVAWISEHARESGAMQKDLPFYKHVVQIEFNAWNYSAGNLWAALVQHILENLRLSEHEDQDMVTARVDHLRREMQLEQQAREAAAAREEEAKKTVAALGEQLRSLRREHAKEVEKLKEVLAADVLESVKIDPQSTSDLNGIRRDLGLPEATAAAGEFLAAVDGARALLRRTSSLVRYVPESQRMRFYLVSALVLVLPPLFALGVGVGIDAFAPQLSNLSAAVSWVSAGLAFGGAWLRNRTRALEQPLAEFERLQAHARQRVEAAERVHRAEAAGLEQRIALAKDEILAAQAKEQEAATRHAQLVAQVAATTPASVLADFVRERAGSEDYRRHLGLPAVIRQDFESISRLVAEENAALARVASLEEERKDAGRRVNRIVLYIDDLDRCPEPLVVEVLQAVHLLLAFPLFVVVVAVDARWVSRSLAQHFPGLLTAGAPGSSDPSAASSGHATPNDYLEKIFQIPFWLRQPGSGAIRQMVRGLVGGGPAPVPTDRHAELHHDDGASPPRLAGAVFRHRQHDPRASSLEVRPEEEAYMEKLAPLLGRSPRALKRFVNVYRLLKASLRSEELDGFLEPAAGGGPPYQDVLLLLALVTGLPDLSDALLDVLVGATPAGGGSSPNPHGTLGTALAGLPQWGDRAREQSARLTGWFDENTSGWRDASLARLATWVPRVSRYSYHLHRG
jgi:hypothetical protein